MTIVNLNRAPNGGLARRPIPIPVRQSVMRASNYRCSYCGCAARTIDHDLPVSRGGTNDPENLIACCLPCNMHKGKKTAAEYMATRGQGAPNSSDEIAAIALSARTLASEIKSLREKRDAVLRGARYHVAALRTAGWSWRKIDARTGVAPSTTIGWIGQFVTGDGPYIEIGRDHPEPTS